MVALTPFLIFVVPQILKESSTSYTVVSYFYNFMVPFLFDFCQSDKNVALDEKFSPLTSDISATYLHNYFSNLIFHL